MGELVRCDQPPVCHGDKVVLREQPDGCLSRHYPVTVGRT